MMRVAVFGSGGREHALCWRMLQDSVPPEITCFPGNPGIKKIVHACEPMRGNLFEFTDSLRGRFDLAVIGPELLLEKGLADRLREVGIPTFGPSAHAARIETSKLFGKALMDQYGIQTAKWLVASTLDTVRVAVTELRGPPVVIKADGLCAGKGVFVADGWKEVEGAIHAIFVENRFGNTSPTVIIEDKLSGIEASFIGISDGYHFVSLACSMDYKQAFEGDGGDNTGGMGAHSPSFVLTDSQFVHMTVVMNKVVRALFDINREFRGALYAGLMIAPDGRIYILEFNARFGDPETQVLMWRLKQDLTPLLFSCAIGNMTERDIAFSDDAASCVTLTSAPYPKTPIVGEHIIGMSEAEKVPGVQIFHAGTALQQDGTLVTAGGRVLSVCAIGGTLEQSLVPAYAASHRLSWTHKNLRGDIGCRVGIKA